MSLFDSEQDRQEFQKQHLANLSAKANDPQLKPEQRQHYAQMLQECIEDQQVEALILSAQHSPNLKVSAGAIPLVKIFMRERAELLEQQNKPRSIGSPTDFSDWLAAKPVFK